MAWKNPTVWSLLMEYVEGTTLRKEIFETDTPFSMERVLEVIQPVTAALHYAHQSGIVHCDVKPANIMLHKNGNILVADFGISRMSESATVTMAGAGTPAYMSPEQITGDMPTPQMDIYALGIILFELLTGGERPFTGEHAGFTATTAEKIRWEQRNREAPSPCKYNPSISPALEKVVLTCLQKDPSTRYKTAVDVYTILKKISDVASSPPQERAGKIEKQQSTFRCMTVKVPLPVWVMGGIVGFVLILLLNGNVTMSVAPSLTATIPLVQPTLSATLTPQPIEKTSTQTITKTLHKHQRRYPRKHQRRHNFMSRQLRFRRKYFPIYMPIKQRAQHKWL